MPDHPRHVVVIGASLAGLFAAAAAATTAATVTILERDELPDHPAPRGGVPQGRQAHVLLHRGHLAAESLLPGLTDDLVAGGAVSIDSGAMPWLGEYGWLPTTIPSYEIVSLTRPLLEHLVRRRVLALPGVALRGGVRVVGIAREDRRWRVHLDPRSTAPPIVADLVVDASGRGSRLPFWLTALGHEVPKPATVEAHLGYACQLYRAPGPLPLTHGLVLAATPEIPRAGLALPVEHDHWLVIAAGYGDARPARSAAEFPRYLAGLRDPALAELAAWLQPEGELAIHRQTGNRRYAYGRGPRWPEGLVVVGDALCAFNPVYGQGITVAAMQAELLRDALPDLDRRGWSRRLQRRLQHVVDLPWSIATSQDVRQPSCESRPDRGQRLSIGWSERLGRLAAAGQPDAVHAFAEVYHLMASPSRLFSPALLAAVVGAEVTGYPSPSPRPPELDALDALARPASASSPAATPSARTASIVSASSADLSGR